jgi:opacity protein-like surface antigen
MVWQRYRFAVLLALVIPMGIALKGTAMAQDENPIPAKNEVTGILGRTFIRDPFVAAYGSDLLFSNGISFEVSYGWRFRENNLYSVTAELPVLFNPHEKLDFVTNVTPDSYKSYFVTPSIRANLLPRTYISPWGSFGVGFGHFSASSQLEFEGGPNPGKTGSTGAVLQLGAGLDVRITHKWGLRTEVRDYWSGVPQVNVDTGRSRQNNLFVGCGVIFHFD